MQPSVSVATWHTYRSDPEQDDSVGNLSVDRSGGVCGEFVVASFYDLVWRFRRGLWAGWRINFAARIRKARSAAAPEDWHSGVDPFFVAAGRIDLESSQQGDRLRRPYRRGDKRHYSPLSPCIGVSYLPRRASGTPPPPARVPPPCPRGDVFF